MPGQCNQMSARLTMQSTFIFRDLRCYVDPADARSYYFLPSAADVRRDGNGQPMITVLDTGSSGYAMFTATWGAAPGSVDALRRDIADGHRDPDASHIRVAFAPVSAPQCHALLGDGSGTFQTIGTSATSGLPPYDALFNLAIPPDRLAHVTRGLNGERGFLAIEYLADLLVPSTASAAFRSQSSSLLAWLRARRGSDTPMRALLEEAVELGLATVTVEAPDHADGQMAMELFDRVLTQAAQAAPRWITEGDSGHLEIEAVVDRNVREPVRAFADIGGIIASAPARPS
jgi:hypothetical protein